MQVQPLAIETIGLTNAFGPHRALDSVSLTIQEGTVFGFLGPNGAGKTTTIQQRDLVGVG
jgi:ABC-2 type transport system ATP-binding protein